MNITSMAIKPVEILFFNTLETEIENSVLDDLLKLNQISIHSCSFHHPQSNALIECLCLSLTENVR